MYLDDEEKSAWHLIKIEFYLYVKDFIHKGALSYITSVDPLSTTMRCCRCCLSSLLLVEEAGKLVW